MAHQRKLIRQALATMLTNAIAEIGDRVFTNRARPIFETDMPCLMVYTESESAELSNEAPREYKRTVQAVVEVVSNNTDNLDDELDDIAEQVEKIVHCDDTISGTVARLDLASSELNISSEGETLFGMVRMTWNMVYYREAPNEADCYPTDDFLTANAGWDLGPEPDDELEAEDDLEMPQ